MVHRDIKIENIFSVDGHVLLNDFGHAVDAGAQVHAGGCLHNASDSVIQARIHGSTYTAGPQDDWIMFLRMCWRYLFPPEHQAVPTEGMVEFFSHMAAPWKEVEAWILGPDLAEEEIAEGITAWFHKVWLAG